MDNNKQMSMFGAGPKLFIVTIIFFIIALYLNSTYNELFRINFLSRSILIIIGIILLISGLTLHVISGKTIIAVHKKDYLCTTGVFKICRHPMYSAWIFFNLPGIALLMGSWLMLIVPVIMYIMFRILIRTEENYLKGRYSKDYENYIKSTCLVFPAIWKLFRAG